MPSRIKIVADDGIPFLKGVFEPYSDVVYLKPGDITRDILLDSDALIIRTRTNCGRELLEGTRISMISSATTGLSHIDLDYCASHGIEVHNAVGSNAGGVMQYVFSSLYGAAAHNSINLSGKTFGIVGAGNVGRRVEQMARHLGFNVLLCDPPRAEVEGDADFVSLETLLASSDIVSLHTPLSESTYHMANAHFFMQMRLGAVFINTASGDIVDEVALVEASPKLGAIIIDAWSDEPNINTELMEVADIATPHIAAYSYQSKMNSSSMAVRSVARRFGIFQLYDFYPAELPDDVPQKLVLSGKTQGEIAATLQYNYPVFTDDFMFRINPSAFDEFRLNYKYRREIYI